MLKIILLIFILVNITSIWILTMLCFILTTFGVGGSRQWNNNFNSLIVVITVFCFSFLPHVPTCSQVWQLLVFSLVSLSYFHAIKAGIPEKKLLFHYFLLLDACQSSVAHAPLLHHFMSWNSHNVFHLILSGKGYWK